MRKINYFKSNHQIEMIALQQQILESTRKKEMNNRKGEKNEKERKQT